MVSVSTLRDLSVLCVSAVFYSLKPSTAETQRTPRFAEKQVNAVDFSLPKSHELDRAEHELVLRCIRPVQTAEDHARIRSLISFGVDWDFLFLFARRHAVLPLLYSGLNKTAGDLIPHTELQRFQKYFQDNLARNALFTAELSRLLKLLGQKGIDAIPYKGPVLSLFAYGDVALRRFVDLDIMVQKDDVEKAIELLLNDGYELSKALAENQRQVLLRTQHNVQFRRHKGQLIVELHWEVSPHLYASSVRAEDLWRNLVAAELNSVAIKVLGPEDLIFSLLIHGSRHLWECLLWICDIGWIVERHELNWQLLLERARTTRNERIFLLGLYLSAQLLNVSLPISIAKEIENDPQLEKLASLVAKRIFKGTVNQPATPLEIFEFHVKVRKSWSAKARYFRHMFHPTDSDVSGIALPRALSFGYYLMRPVRLLLKTGEDTH